MARLAVAFEPQRIPHNPNVRNFLIEQTSINDEVFVQIKLNDPEIDWLINKLQAIRKGLPDGGSVRFTT